MTDDEFIDAFQTCALSSEHFNHRGHLRIAWLFAKRCPLAQAIERTCDGIDRCARHFGAAEKYHRTMSEALVRLIVDAQSRAPAQSFDEFLQSNPLLVTDVRLLLGRYYSSGLLCSQEAKQRFVPPDLEALPR